MSDDSEAVEIYDREDVQQIIVHPDRKRCITVSSRQAKMFSLHSHEHLMDLQELYLDIWDAALFDNDTLMAYTEGSEIVLWSFSNGTISLRLSKMKLKLQLYYPPLSIFPLRSNQFMIIGKHKKRGLFRARAIACMLKKPADDSATLRVLATCTIPEIRDISSHRNHFAVSISGKNEIQLWAWESEDFHCIKVLDVGFTALRVALSDKYFLCVGATKNHLYNSSTMDFIRKLRSPLPTSDIVTICNDTLLMSSSYCSKSTLAVLDVDGGAMLWNTSFGTRIQAFQLSVSNEVGVYLIVATENGRVLQCSLPSDITSKIMAASSAVSVLPPLQDALSRCLAGEASPAEYCDSLVTFSTCSASFQEWCSAHQLLVLAVRNGEIDESTEHKGSIAHWFEKLYLAVKDLDLTSAEDLAVAKRYLREAKRMSLIEGIEAVLAALHVTNQVHEEVRALHRAGILIFERVMRIEKRFDMLKESFEQYRRRQMYSQCIGIALQIIPIVGGASAGVISVGANIVEGLSIKDMADYAFGLGSSLTEGEMPSLGERIFRRAAEVLSPESVAKMKEEGLRLVEEAVSACGLSVEELRLLFIQRSKEDNRSCMDEDGVMKEDEAERSEEPEIYLALQEMTLPAFETEGPILEKREFEGICCKKQSELQRFDLSSAVIQDLDQREIATLWAAFIVRFDDVSLDAFQRLRERILLVLEANELDGAVLVDRDVISSIELAKAVVDGLNNDGKGELTIGARVKVRQFMNAII